MDTKRRESMWTPPQLVEELKKLVIGQDEYLEDLCTTIWMQAMKQRIYEETGIRFTDPKLNMLVVGKSGSGKTSTIRALAKLLDLPVVEEDASMFTGTGWRGRDVSSIIQDIISFEEDPARIDYSIVVLDEIDKIIGCQVADSTFYAINNFLKMMDGTFIRHGEGGRDYCMNTSTLLFICIGAFDGLENIIRKRLYKQKQIGFALSEKEPEPKNLLRYATREDLIAYGVNPQFLGRISTLTVMNPLGVPEYERILTEAKDSIVCQYDKLLEAALGVRVSLTAAAAHEIAKRAEHSKEGARTLAQEVTQELKSGIYHASTEENVKEICLDAQDGQLVLTYTRQEHEEMGL